MLAHALQDIDQVVIRIDIVQSARHEQALNDADIPGAQFGPTEQPIFAAERIHPQRTFEVIGVDLDTGACSGHDQSYFLMSVACR